MFLNGKLKLYIFKGLVSDCGSPVWDILLPDIDTMEWAPVASSEHQMNRVIPRQINQFSGNAT